MTRPRPAPIQTNAPTLPPLPPYDGTSGSPGAVRAWLSRVEGVMAEHPQLFLGDEDRVEYAGRFLAGRPGAWYAYHRGITYLTSWAQFTSALLCQFEVLARVPASDTNKHAALEFLACVQGPDDVAAYIARFGPVRKAYAAAVLERARAHYDSRAGQKALTAAWFLHGLRADVRREVEADCAGDVGGMKGSDLEAAALRAERRLKGEVVDGWQEKREQGRYVSYEDGLGAGGRAMRLGVMGLPPTPGGLRSPHALPRSPRCFPKSPLAAKHHGQRMPKSPLASKHHRM